jgi:nitrate reductase delta subunit
MLLQLLSRLLDYPEQALFQHRAEIQHMIEAADISDDSKEGLQQFVQKRCDQALLDWQAEYDALFDRGRSLGLWLFEHVHGESRDRGQAMVDLLEKYREANLELGSHELPDYIPLFLEFLSTQGDDNARLWLQEVAEILALLQCRLQRRNSDYAALFIALLDYSRADVDIEAMYASLDNEQRDDTKKALDKSWEEQEVSFAEDSLQQCSTGARRPSVAQEKQHEAPMHWVGFDASDLASATQASATLASTTTGAQQ